MQAGKQVGAFVRYNSRNHAGHLEALPITTADAIELYSGDFEDARAIEKAAEGIDTVFHLLPRIAIPYSYQHPAYVV